MPEIVTNIVDVYPFRRTGGRVEFLLLHRAADRRIGATWQAVHGRIEPGESAAQAAVRELREEAGLIPQRLWQLEHVNTFYLGREDAIAMCPGFAAEVAADAAVVLNAEHTAFRWLAAEEALSELMWPGQRTAVREVLDVIVSPGAAEPLLRMELPTRSQRP